MAMDSAQRMEKGERGTCMWEPTASLHALATEAEGWLPRPATVVRWACEDFGSLAGRTFSTRLV